MANVQWGWSMIKNVI